MYRLLLLLSAIAGFFGIPAAAQQYVISTYAGGGAAATLVPYRVDSPGAATGVGIDRAGNLYVASPGSNAVFRIDPAGVLTLFAGTSRIGYSGDGGPATQARLLLPTAVAVDDAGNVFIADSGNNCVRKVLPSGVITTVAGNRGAGFSGDGGPATRAQLNRPGGVAVDRAGNLYVGDPGNFRIRKVSAAGIITTVAGSGMPGYSGDGGPATEAKLLLGGCCQVGIAVDTAGSLFIADNGNARVRKVSAAGIISTVAGNGVFGISGDGGAATDANLAFPVGVWVDGTGNLYIVHYGAVRKVSTAGMIATVAGNGECCGFSGDGGPATAARVGAVAGVVTDTSGNLFIADNGNHRIRKVSADGIIRTIAGNDTPDISGDGGTATNARLAAPVGLAVDADGSLFIAESVSSRVRKVSRTGVITTVAGGGSASAPLSLFGCNSLCGGLAVDRDGNLYVADPGNGLVRKVSRSGIITTVAGGGSESSGREGPALSTVLLGPYSVAVDSAGNLFIAEAFDSDSELGRVRKVTPDGIIRTVAGGGTAYPGDGGPAIEVSLGLWLGVAVDRAGNLFIADQSRGRVRKVSTDGIITTVAGNGSRGHSGDGGPATAAGFDLWIGIAVDDAGNLYLGDHDRVRKVSPDGIVHTIASTGLSFLTSVAVDGSGNVYAADWYDNVVYLFQLTDQSLLVASVADAASRQSGSITPGEIVVINGSGLGPAELTTNNPSNGFIGADAGGTTVSIGGFPAPVLYSWATQVAAIVPFGVTGPTAQLSVIFAGYKSNELTLQVSPSAPNLFTLNETGAGQATALNVVDRTQNSPANPVRVGDRLTLYATGAGLTVPAGIDGKIDDGTPWRSGLPVSVTIDGITAASVSYGGTLNQVTGLMQIDLQVPPGVRAGGYVPVVLQVGDRRSDPAVWIAVTER